MRPGAIARFGGSGDLGIDSGIVMTSGTVTGLFAPFTSWGTPSSDNSGGWDADLASLVSGSVYDVCVLEFDFVPAGYEISFNYVFGSSEYGDFSCSIYNDPFVFFISGNEYTTPQNIAVIPGTSIPVCVNSTTGVGTWVLYDSDCTGMGPGSPFTDFYINNIGGVYIRYGGYTTVLTATATVTPCDTYHLKLAIGDVADAELDSGVFVEAGSLQSSAITVTAAGGGGLGWPHSVAVRGCEPGSFTITRSVNLDAPVTIDYVLAGTAVNGVDYSYLPGSVTIPAGDSSVTLYVSPCPLVQKLVY